MVTENEFGLEARFAGKRNELLQGRRDRCRERFVHQVGERSAPHQRERLREAHRCRGGVVAGCLLLRRREPLAELEEVELHDACIHDVPGTLRAHDVIDTERNRRRLERFAQVGDVHLERAHRAIGCILSPQDLDDPRRGHDVIRLRQQEREKAALLRTAERDRFGVDQNFERPEHPEPDVVRSGDGAHSRGGYDGRSGSADSTACG